MDPVEKSLATLAREQLDSDLVKAVSDDRELLFALLVQQTREIKESVKRFGNIVWPNERSRKSFSYLSASLGLLLPLTLSASRAREATVVGEVTRAEVSRIKHRLRSWAERRKRTEAIFLAVLLCGCAFLAGYTVASVWPHKAASFLKLPRQ